MESNIKTVAEDEIQLSLPVGSDDYKNNLK